MQRTHLFIIDPLEKLNLALDTSLRIALALSQKHSDVYICYLHDLYWENGKRPYCKAKQVHFSNGIQRFETGDILDLPLDGFFSIHMRKDPPFDMAYFTATWFLGFGKKTLCVNAPEALRGFNEKMGILQFPKESKHSLVSSNPKQIFNFIEDICHGDAVLKPLDLYGGKGIIHLKTKDLSKNEIEKTLIDAMQNGPRLVQAFDPHIYDGEVRVFLVGGKALSWCLKIPKAGEFLANTGSGASLHSYQPSKSLCKKVELVAQELLKQGIYFVGMDLINEEISEINITSPRLLMAPGDSRDYYSEIADWILNQRL